MSYRYNTIRTYIFIENISFPIRPGICRIQYFLKCFGIVAFKGNRLKYIFLRKHLLHLLRLNSQFFDVFSLVLKLLYFPSTKFSR